MWNVDVSENNKKLVKISIFYVKVQPTYNMKCEESSILKTENVEKK